MFGRAGYKSFLFENETLRSCKKTDSSLHQQKEKDGENTEISLQEAVSVSLVTYSVTYSKEPMFSQILMEILDTSRGIITTLGLRPEGKR